MKKPSLRVTVFVALGAAVALAWACSRFFPRKDYDAKFRQWQQETTKIVVYDTYVVDADAGELATRRQEISDPILLTGILSAIRLERMWRYESIHDMCGGNPRIDLYAGQKQLSSFTIHHGRFIRCREVDSSDIRICDDTRAELVRQLAALGIREYVVMKKERGF